MILSEVKKQDTVQTHDKHSVEQPPSYKTISSKTHIHKGKRLHLKKHITDATEVGLLTFTVFSLHHRTKPTQSFMPQKSMSMLLKLQQIFKIYQIVNHCFKKKEPHSWHTE